MAEQIPQVYKKIGSKLVKLREQKGLDQLTATKMLRWGSSRLGQYERAERKLDLEALEELAKFYEVLPQELVDWPIEELDEEERQLIREWRKIPEGTARKFVLTLLESWSVQSRSVNGW